jgi:DNA-binding transcriptional LysR family regulator
VAAISRRIAAAFAGPLELSMFPPPLPLPRSRVGQVWHEQVHADPGHRWLRGIIAEEARLL